MKAKVNVSSKNIDISVSGPVLIGGGEILTFQVDVSNRNNTRLETVDLIIEFPEGTRSASSTDDELTRLRQSLGDIGSGDRVTQTVSARLFGEEDAQKQIIIGVEYRVADSNAIFLKEKTFDIQIGTAPISFLVDMPTEVNSNQEIELVLEVVSNAQETIENVAIFVEYPFGFIFDNADPEPDTDDYLWIFGDLEPGGRRTVRLSGSIEGQDEEERTFRFTGGLVDENSRRDIATTLLVASRSLTIKRPFVQVDARINGSSDDIYVALPRDTVNVNVGWQNNLTSPVENAVITAELIGPVLDESTVETFRGFYRSIDNTVVWDSARVPELSRLEPGASGDFAVSFRSLDPAGTLFSNESIDVVLTITGDRIGDSRATTGEITSSTRRVVQFATDADVDGRIVYTTGPFANTGPIPPKADQETTYTVIWSVTNTSNTIAGTEVSVALPDYVRFLGIVNPSDEEITFNSSSSELRWNVGNVSSGTGYTGPPREVSFQIAVTPSLSQAGISPVLVGSAILRAQDTFTDTLVTGGHGELTTEIKTDPTYSFGKGRVVE